MAEAHQAVAFSFSITNEGVIWNVNSQALRAVWKSGVRSWNKTVTRIKNKFRNGIYPARPDSWMSMMFVVFAAAIVGYDVSLGIVNRLESVCQSWFNVHPPHSHTLAAVIFSLAIWLSGVLARKYTLMSLLGYTAWMYEMQRRSFSWRTKVWHTLVQLLGGRSPKLYSYQGSLPKMPVPAVNDTIKRYLRSVRPLLNDEQYKKMETLASEFRNTMARRLQFYLTLKSWWAPNYVSDWWEEYVYLYGRSPIMINSNFYGMDAFLVYPTTVQAARAANMVYGCVQFMLSIEHEELSPIMMNKMIPLCSRQYERQFCSTRVPGVEKDRLVHLRESHHIVVYYKGRYFKCYINHNDRWLEPCELEKMFQAVIDDKSEPAEGEEHVAALTAGDREPWARARKTHFDRGVNRVSLDAIEKSAFVLVLDDSEPDLNMDNSSELDKYAHSLLHGKGYDRWFDKSFNLVVFRNGRIGFNAEHSWADAPIMAHLWELTIFQYDLRSGYTADGHSRGVPVQSPPNPIRLQWDLSPECQKVAESSLKVATALINDVDLHVAVHKDFGKGFIKTAKVSPDAFIQLAFQLAYYRDAGKFCLTYEASMTRMFLEGRTETVRSCSIESSAFVLAMENPDVSTQEKIRLLKVAAENHQVMYRDSMTGRGVDRHLFCLYVISKYLGIESEFLRAVLSEPWRLSTSQTAHGQTDLLDFRQNPTYISAGGGFGPVADDGYGVAYMLAGEDMIFFHISSKLSCPTTSSIKFGQRIREALADMRLLFVSSEKP